MSLLLDALQRASKDKEKAAAAAADTAISPAQPTALQTDPGRVEEPADSEYPTLVAPMVPAPMAAQSVPPVPEMELTLEMPKAPPPPEPPPPPSPEHHQERELDPVPAPAPAPVLAQAIPRPDPPPESLRAADVPPPTPTPSNAAPAVEPENVKPVVVPADRAAQEIRRAYASLKPQTVSRGRRLLAWAVLFGLLALAVASVVLGVWGDPSALLRLVQPSSVAPAYPPPAAIPAELPPATVPSVPASETSVMAPVGASSAPRSSEVPAPASAKSPEPVAAKATTRSRPAPARRSTEMLAPPPAKPTFTAKVSEPNPLESGYSALVAGRYEEATLAYERALKTNPDERDALLGLAYINHHQGRLDDARSYYRKVLRIDPGNATANSGLLALDMDGDATRTAGRARDLASRRPDSAAAMAAAGTAFVRDGLVADAAVAFARAQALEPGNPLHAYNHAVALDRLGQLEQAVVQYEKALNLSASAGANGRGFQMEAVRIRVDQLRRALDKQNGSEE